MLTKRVEIKKRLLPHWRVDDGTYFVTSRLADSLPDAVLRDLASRPLPYGSSEEAARKYRQRIERLLDRGFGECLLRRDAYAQIVDDVVRKFDGIRYRLGPWTIMPNHMHNVVRPFRGNTLDQVIGAWKSVSAHVINKRFGRRGSLWQEESYDSWLRDENELRRVQLYIVQNPVKAQLRDWKWVSEPSTDGLLVQVPTPPANT